MNETSASVHFIVARAICALFSASENAGDRPPVTWRERTSHVTGHFPATQNVGSDKIDHLFAQRRTVVNRRLPAI